MIWHFSLLISNLGFFMLWELCSEVAVVWVRVLLPHVSAAPGSLSTLELCWRIWAFKREGARPFQPSRLRCHDTFCNMSCCQELSVALLLQQVRKRSKGPGLMQFPFHTAWPRVSFSMSTLQFCCGFLYFCIEIPGSGSVRPSCNFTSMHLWLLFPVPKSGGL